MVAAVVGNVLAALNKGWGILFRQEHRVRLHAKFLSRHGGIFSDSLSHLPAKHNNRWADSLIWLRPSRQGKNETARCNRKRGGVKPVTSQTNMARLHPTTKASRYRLCGLGKQRHVPRAAAVRTQSAPWHSVHRIRGACRLRQRLARSLFLCEIRSLAQTLKDRFQQ